MRTKEEYKEAVYSYFIELEESKRQLQEKYRVQLLTNDMDRAKNEYCYDLDFEHPDLTRKDVIKNPKDYKEAHRLGITIGQKLEPKRDTSELDLPSEVIRIIGSENLFMDNPILYNSMLASLERLYKTRGIEYIRKNRESLIASSKALEMFR